MKGSALPANWITSCQSLSKEFIIKPNIFSKNISNQWPFRLHLIIMLVCRGTFVTQLLPSLSTIWCCNGWYLKHWLQTATKLIFQTFDLMNRHHKASSLTRLLQLVEVVLARRLWTIDISCRSQAYNLIGTTVRFWTKQNSSNTVASVLTSHLVTWPDRQ